VGQKAFEEVGVVVEAVSVTWVGRGAMTSPVSVVELVVAGGETVVPVLVLLLEPVTTCVRVLVVAPEVSVMTTVTTTSGAAPVVMVVVEVEATMGGPVALALGTPVKDPCQLKLKNVEGLCCILTSNTLAYETRNAASTTHRDRTRRVSCWAYSHAAYTILPSRTAPYLAKPRVWDLDALLRFTAATVGIPNHQAVVRVARTLKVLPRLQSAQHVACAPEEVPPSA
jgi:hypothetical protein